MQDTIINKVCQSTDISKNQVITTLNLLKEGNTVPFIARYRKEATKNLDEDQILTIFKEYEHFNKLEEKKENTINKIQEKGMLTDELVQQIKNAQKISEIDDIYLPFKQKKKTKASEAINAGLSPLADYVYKHTKDLDLEAEKYISDIYKTKEEVIQAVGYIIAQRISDNSQYRKLIRDNVYKNGDIISKIKKSKEELDPKEKYTMYYDFKQKINKIPSYRYLAITRAEKEKILTINIEYNNEWVIQKILQKETNYKEHLENKSLILECIKDGYKRLIFPSIVREIRKELKEKSDTEAIKIFCFNFEKLIMQKPLKGRWILGLDPAFRTGCKYAVIDNNASKKEIGVIFPHAPVNDIKSSEKKIKELISKYKIEQIVIGNGTASRETQEFIKNMNLNIKYNLISEAGASVYSASKVAQEEFPDLKVEYRSAISIARRIQDPMAELVKIDAKSIGVGQYQHDVDQKELSKNLDFVSEKVVNQVGVDLNTASKQLLTYVSGLDKTLAKNIVKYRETHGSFKSRKELLEVERLGKNTFYQCAGFLKILNGKDYLDETFIHPEDYEVANKILKKYKNIKSKEFKIKEIDLTQECEILNISKIKFLEIIEYLQKPNLDVREEIITAEFEADITSIEDLKVGGKIQGEVRNILEFGAFVDIGLKNDALIHISEISNNFVKNVRDFLDVGDIKEFKIKEIDINLGKIKLTLKG